MEHSIPEILERCAGIDVHKKTAVITIMIGSGKKMIKETRTFSTMTPDLRTMAQWIKDNGIFKVVIESTGVYWKPVFNVIEGEYQLEIVLANAYHVKNVPHRKSDVRDSEWLCYLLKNGFINPSFIPPIDIRNLREFVRLRQSHNEILTAAKNRLIKFLESKNIKLSSVLTDCFGITGFNVIRMLATGCTEPDKLITHFGNNIKATKDTIRKALTGTFKNEDLELIQMLLRHIDEEIALIQDIERKIDCLMQQYNAECSLLKTIPGIGEKVSRVIIAEAGTNMAIFSTGERFASWTGLVPRTNESAGKRKNTSISGGNRHIRNAFVEAAWAAARTKNSYWKAEFHRLRPRLGVKKAIVAIARKLAECVHSVLSKKKTYQERGAHSVESRLKERRIQYHLKMLKELGAEAH